MDTFSRYVGGRIKLFRKKKNLTLNELSVMISKSKSTVYKYETGAISLDLDTLYDIALALGIKVTALTDYPASTQKKAFSKELPCTQPNAYLYNGIVEPHDTVTYLILRNYAAQTEQLIITILNSFRYDSPSVAGISGISANPFALICVKGLFSKTILAEDSTLLDQLRLTREDFRSLKTLNMFTIQHMG